MRPRTSGSFAVLFALVAVSGALSAFGNEFQWEHITGNRRWDTCGNWVVNASPPPAHCSPSNTGDNALLPYAANGNGNVLFNYDRTIGDLIIEGSVAFSPLSDARTLTVANLVLDASGGDIELTVVSSTVTTD